MCFSNFPLVKKVYGEEGGSIKIFRRKFYYLTLPQNSVEEHFIVSLFSGFDKFYASKGFTTFRRNFFYLTAPKNSLGEPFSVSLISGIETFYASEGCHNFQSKLLSHSTEKLRRGTLLCCASGISGSEKVYG